MSGRTYRDKVSVGTRSIYPVAGNPDGAVTGEAGDIGIDPGGATYECLGGTVWAMQQPVKIFANAAAAQAYAGGVEGQMAYVTNALTYYIWRANPGNAADGVHVLTTGDGGTTRWTGVSGLYIGQPVNSFSANAVIQGVRYQSGNVQPDGVVASLAGSRYVNTTTGQVYINQDGAQAWALSETEKYFADVAAAQAYTTAAGGDKGYVATNSTVYRYVENGVAYTVDGSYVLSTGSGGNTRWVGQDGQYIAERSRFKQKVSSDSAIQGQLVMKQEVYQASYAVESGKAVHVLDGSLAVVDATLPTAGNDSGETFTFIVTDITNLVRILPAGGDTINDNPVAYIPTIVPSVVTFASDGNNNWDIIFRGFDPARERQRVMREVAVSGGNTVEAHGAMELPYRLVGLYVMCSVVATVPNGPYTLTGERQSDSAVLLNPTPFDLTTAGTLAAGVWTEVGLTATVADRTFTLPMDGFIFSFISGNAALDAEGVNWLAVIEMVN